MIPSQLSLFVTVAEEGNFSSASRKLGLSSAAVSKGIAQLEKQIGVRLFHRNTRQFSLTDDGTTLFQQVSPLLSQIQCSVDGLSEQNKQPTGKIRINLPDSFGRGFVLPYLSEFLQTYPNIELDLVFDDNVRDIIKEGFDIGIGNRLNEDSRLIARPIYPLQMGIFASQSYIEQYGLPTTIEALEQHNCIAFKPGDIMTWALNSPNGEQIQFMPKGNLTLSDMGTVCTVVRAGVGISSTGYWHFEEELKQGTIIPILESYWSEAKPIWIYYSSKKNQPKRIRLFIDFLMAKIAQRTN